MAERPWKMPSATMWMGIFLSDGKNHDTEGTSVKKWFEAWAQSSAPEKLGFRLVYINHRSQDVSYVPTYLNS